VSQSLTPKKPILKGVPVVAVSLDGDKKKDGKKEKDVKKRKVEVIESEDEAGESGSGDGGGF
jgi:hypothetical protein